MYAVSDAWKKAHEQILLPESHVEVTVGVTDVSARDLARVDAGGTQAVFSNERRVVGDIGTPTPAQYATLEHNLWILDGTRSIIPDSAPYKTPGYVSDRDGEGELTITFDAPRDATIPGFTITWGSEYNEYPTEFSITVGNTNGLSSNGVYVRDNATSVTEVELEVSNYDTVTITVHNWNMPYRRKRIDRISFGHAMTFGKNDLLDFKHSQVGCLSSSGLPKNSIEFSLDNVDGRWNPYNPTGIEKYLSERQLVTVRYGLSGDRGIEWINAGTFYMSEWRASPNGLKATFSARDVFEYLLNSPYDGVSSGTLLELTQAALCGVYLPSDFVANLDESLSNYSATITEPHTCAEVVQMCANAAGCVVYQNRDGVLEVKPLHAQTNDYRITQYLSYSHPEVELSKPLKAVSVKYGENESYLLNVGTVGEVQTVENPLVSNAEQAMLIAWWIRNTIEPRKMVSGEFRADPRLDVFDIISVDSKYGTLEPVAITEITYTYSGTFKGRYSGRVLTDEYLIKRFILGVSRLGEGVL